MGKKDLSINYKKVVKLMKNTGSDKRKVFSKLKNTREKLCIILGVVLLLYIILINTISSSKIAFSKPICFFAVVIIAVGFMYDKIYAFIQSKSILKKLVKIIKICIALIIAVLIVIEGVIVVYPKHNISKSDYILILGAGLSNGSEPSLTLSGRLDAAIEYIKDYNNHSKIVVSGGKGNDEKISEAEAMKKYLVSKGMPEGQILMENKSTTTYENFKFSKELIEEDSNKEIDEINVKVVTTDFHAFRSKFLAQKNGYNNVTNYSSETVWYLIPVMYLREGFAVVKSLVFD